MLKNVKILAILKSLAIIKHVQRELVADKSGMFDEVCTTHKRRSFIMNKEELVQEIAKKSNVTQKEAAEVLAALVETIQKTVSKGKKVTLVGFGTFESRKRAARIGRNPQTGKELKIPATTVPAFSAGKRFKEVVNKK